MPLQSFNPFVQGKIFLESYVQSNNIPWWNIDFEKSYVTKFKKRKPEEKFDKLQHLEYINFFDYFVCKCGKSHNSGTERRFQPQLWNCDNRHRCGSCPFRHRSEYFKLISSSTNKKVMNKKGSLMLLKKKLRYLKLDYNIWLWVKDMNCAGYTEYKVETQLLREFRDNVLKRKKKVINNKEKNSCLEIENMVKDRVINSPEYHPVSPSV